MQTSFMQLRHGSLAYVALYTGISPGDLRSLVSAVFGTTKKVVGFQSGDVTLPISVACQHPESISRSEYTLLFENSSASETEESDVEGPVAPAGCGSPRGDRAAFVRLLQNMVNNGQMTQGESSGVLSLISAYEEFRTSSDPSFLRETLLNVLSGAAFGDSSDSESDYEDEDEDGEGDPYGQLIIFVDELLDFGLLSPEGHEALLALVNESDSLVANAYVVARLERDPQLLAILFSQIAEKATNGLAPEMRAQQSTLLHAVLALERVGQIGEAEAYYLRRMIIVGNPLLDAAYDAFEFNGDENDLVDTLARIAYHAAEAEEESDYSDDDSEDDDGRYPARPSAPTPDKDEMVSILRTLQRSGHLERNEERALEALLSQENPTLLAVFEVHQREPPSLESATELVQNLRAIANAALTQGSGFAGAQFIDDDEDSSSYVPSDDSGYSTDSSGSDDDGYPTDELRHLISIVRGEGAIDDEAVATLAHRIAAKDSRLEVAYSRFARDMDGNKLVRTVIQLSEPDLDPMSSEESSSGAGSDCDSSEEEGEDADDGNVTLEQVVSALYGEDWLNREQAKLAMQLYHNQDSALLGAWEVCKLQMDVQDFLDTLLRILRLRSGGPSLPIRMPNDDDEGSDGSGVDSESESEDEGAGGSGAPNVAGSRELRRETLTTVLNLMEQHKIAPQRDVETLRELVAQDHDSLRAALEAFESDEDISELIDTLRVISAAARMEESSTRDDFDRRSATLARLAARSKMLTPSDVELLRQLVAGRNELVLAAFEVHDNDGNDDELEDTLWRVVRRYTGGATTSTTNEAPDGSDAARELLELVNVLEAEGKVGHALAGTLKQLVRAEDDRVMAAHDVYISEQDVEDLIDTLVLIGSQESAAAAEDEDDDDSGDEYPPDFEDDDSYGAQDGGAGAAASIPDVAVSRLVDVVELLENVQQLTAQQGAIIKALVRARDPRVVETFNAHNSGEETLQPEDVNRLVSALQQLADSVASGEAPQASAQPEMSVNEKLLHIVQSMRLSEEETAALRLCIRNGDVAVGAALEVYRLEGDEEDLKDTLTRVARRGASRAAVPADSADDEPPALEEVEDDDDEEEDEENEQQQPQPRLGLPPNVNREGLTIVQAILATATDWTDEQKELAMYLYTKGNVIVCAALDVYASEGDESEFLDTVRRLVSVA